MTFRHERIDPAPPSGRLGFCLPTDLTGSGYPDIIIGGMGASYQVDVPIADRRIKLEQVPGVRELIRRRESNLFWYEHPTWERHEVASAPMLSIGADVGDILGDGSVTLVAGQNKPHRNLWWFDIPEDPRSTWDRYTITDDYVKYHDVLVADVDNDGEDEVIACSQESETVFYYDIPDDPRTTPWPTTNRHEIATGLDVEGLSVADVDNDGTAELIAGANVFRQHDDGTWQRDPLGDDWAWTRVGVGDVDGDEHPEVVVTEGDRPYHDGRPGRLGVFDPPMWSESIVRSDLSNPHTLQLADVDGDGTTEIFVAEMGVEPDHVPRQFLVSYDGNGGYECQELNLDMPTHEAKLVDLTGNGELDIVGKAYGEAHVDIWYSEGGWTHG